MAFNWTSYLPLVKEKYIGKKTTWLYRRVKLLLFKYKTTEGGNPMLTRSDLHGE